MLGCNDYESWIFMKLVKSVIFSHYNLINSIKKSKIWILNDWHFLLYFVMLDNISVEFELEWYFKWQNNYFIISTALRRLLGNE